MNIILISIDNLRYDCVTYQPFKKELERYGVDNLLKTPTLDKIAEESICFNQAITTTPYTTSAHASLLTGLYPPSHGVREFWNQKMFPEARTLPELLKDLGYKTVLYSDTIHFKNSNSGIDKGFDYYFTTSTEEDFYHFLSENCDHKLLVLVHFFDVHGPFLFSGTKMFKGYNDDYFQLMEKLYNKYGRETEYQELKEKPYDLWNTFFLKLKADDDSYRLGLSLFIQGVNKFDKNRFSFFIRNLKDTGIYDKSALFIFSDHGEGKSDKNNRFDHFGELYDSVIRIPLIIHLPDTTHKVIDNQVSIVDICPTILETLCNCKTEELLPYGLSGYNLISGKDNSLWAYAETWLPATQGDIYGRTNYLKQRGIRTKEKKYILHGKTEDIFDSSIYSLNNKEFVRKLHSSLLYEPENAICDLYTSLLDENKLNKSDVLHIFLGLKNSKNDSRFMIFDLVKDPFEERPIDPTNDISQITEFGIKTTKLQKNTIII
jgi:arylsulfatase A-like enzyme